MNFFKILLVLLIASTSWGDSFSIYLENDFFGGKDQHYTHGTRLSYGRGDLNYVGGQYIYTPNHKGADYVQPNDRPYSGWLYVGVGKSFVNLNKYSYIEGVVGVTGEWSFAGKTQWYVHKWTGNGLPNGWDYQIGNSVAANLNATHKRRYGNRYIDIIPQVNGALGTYYIGAGIGATCRLGYHLPDTFGPRVIQPSISAVKGKTKISSWKESHLYLRGIGSWVGYNTALDGRMFHSDIQTIEKEPLVGHLEYGFVTYISQLEFKYSYIIKTEEFVGQPHSAKYGSVQVTWRW